MMVAGIGGVTQNGSLSGEFQVRGIDDGAVFLAYTKHVPPAGINLWNVKHGYDLSQKAKQPLFFIEIPIKNPN
ncbi:FMN reductase [Mobiluncus mulieris]|nr:FMN reductase [Mobiluncus mulieris]PNL44284.1 FMN reductase [Mobiluncus mulieris]